MRVMWKFRERIFCKFFFWNFSRQERIKKWKKKRFEDCRRFSKIVVKEKKKSESKRNWFHRIEIIFKKIQIFSKISSYSLFTDTDHPHNSHHPSLYSLHTSHRLKYSKPNSRFISPFCSHKMNFSWTIHPFLCIICFYTAFELTFSLFHSSPFSCSRQHEEKAENTHMSLLICLSWNLQHFRVR